MPIHAAHRGTRKYLSSLLLQVLAELKSTLNLLFPLYDPPSNSILE